MHRCSNINYGCHTRRIRAEIKQGIYPVLVHFVKSAAELQSHFYVALDRKYVDQKAFEGIYQQADKVGRMDSNLITYLRECDRRYIETKKTRKTK